MPKPEILTVPPVEAIAHFQAKGFHVGFDWRDTDAAQHLKSFTVAKAMNQDILQDVRGAVDSALAKGETFRQFRARLEPTLKAKGWWGRKDMLDPLTGQLRNVQLGSPRRLRIIFDTNLRTSYARGRWERIERVAEERPWLRYVAVLDERTRPDHAAWDGTVLRWDDPFWNSHYPPNGWRCRCLVQQLSDDDLAAFGFDPSPGPPPGSQVTRPWTNKRTGKLHHIPVPGLTPASLTTSASSGGRSRRSGCWRTRSRPPLPTSRPPRAATRWRRRIFSPFAPHDSPLNRPCMTAASPLHRPISVDFRP